MKTTKSTNTLMQFVDEQSNNYEYIPHISTSYHLTRWF
jgi:hypothetical protein